MTTTVAPPATIGDELARQGWDAEPGTRVRWVRSTPAGPATLSRAAGSSAWDEWWLNGGAVPGAADPLAANAAVAGPGKLVRHAAGGCAWRFDLPRGLFDPADEYETDGMLAEWVRTVSAVADGEPAEAAPADPAEVAAALEKAGWPVVAADGVVRVRVPLPGLFRQIVLDGPRAWCELTDLDGADDDGRRAVLHLAAAANDRLRLARFTLARGGAEKQLVVEAYVGASGVPGRWAGGAIEAAHAAVVLAARELAALRGDRELARAYLAAHAAGERRV